MSEIVAMPAASLPIPAFTGLVPGDLRQAVGRNTLRGQISGYFTGQIGLGCQRMCSHHGSDIEWANLKSRNEVLDRSVNGVHGVGVVVKRKRVLRPEPLP